MSESSDRVSWGSRTDTGRVRAINQDSVHAQPELFVVADGMGGHQGGEVASAVAVSAMTSEGTPPPSNLDELVARVHRANAAVLERAEQEEELAGMGTTLCALAVLEADWRDGLHLAMVNVGDSRIYRFADGRLEQVSADHSLVAELVRDGHLTSDEALVHPQRNIVTRALGIVPDVDVDAWEVSARRGERFLLCSDGLVNEVTDAQIAATFRRLDDPAEVVDELVRLAHEGGSRDNVTVVVVQVNAGDAGPAAAIPGSADARSDAAAAAAVTAAGTSTAAGADAAALSRGGVGLREGVDPEPAIDSGLGYEGDDATQDRRVRRVGRMRAAITVAVIAFVVAAGLVIIGLYARNNYFVSFDEDQIVIYQGRPGGVLWFDPTIEVPTPFLRSDLTDALALEIDAIPEFGTLSEAEDYVDDLSGRIESASNAATAGSG